MVQTRVVPFWLAVLCSVTYLVVMLATKFCSQLTVGVWSSCSCSHIAWNFLHRRAKPGEVLLCVCLCSRVWLVAGKKFSKSCGHEGDLHAVHCGTHSKFNWTRRTLTVIDWIWLPSPDLLDSWVFISFLLFCFLLHLTFPDQHQRNIFLKKQSFGNDLFTKLFANYR